MLDYLDAARAEDFTGRQWLYREIEDAFRDKHMAGVQIVGSPGSGKSALSSNLICSRSSSPIIHNSILGYHFCKYSDKNTQMAGKFVRNLAEMIARRLPEYGYLVSNDSLIKRSLKEDCIYHQDPVGCFELTVLSPLKKLTKIPRKNWFVVVDALDECITPGETGYSIVYLINNKIHRFPTWFKVIVTSRNESEATLRSSKVKKIAIDPEDRRNLKDLEIFVTRRLLQETPLLLRLRRWFGDDSLNSITKSTTEVLSKSQGNFLFVNELLNHWGHSRLELRNAFVLPKSLGDLFHTYFKRLYPSIESFKSVRHILELLVSTFEPLTHNQMFDLLKVRENSLDEYDFKNRLRELGHFLKIGKDNTLTLYHLSLTEWLTSEENEKYFVSKEKGHEVFCDYYFGVVRDRKKNRPKDYILALTQHIVLGGSKEAHVQEFLSLPSQTINSSDPQNNRTLLHSAATIDNRDALELVLRHFSCIDCVDDRGITPAFLAAERGFVDNLVLLVKKGAKINHKTKTMVSFYKANFLTGLRNVDIKLIDYYKPLIIRIPNAIHESKSKYFDSSMLHAAAQRGRASVVRFLIQNNTNLSLLNGVQLTAIQIAAEKGHLEIVKSLYEAGAVADQTALHHAAANNRLEVVNYLLDIGVKDKCLRCDGSFYWVEGGKHRLTNGILFLRPPKKEYCSLWENTWPDENKTLFDDKHLILCHSALHAAVASGHDKVVTRLLSEKHNALNCHDYSGRTPLHEAVLRNNTIIVNSLLEKQSRMIHNKCKHWQKLDKKNESMEYNFEYYDEVCTCGYTPLHVAARYGLHQLAALLIRKGARVDDRDCSGTTPLHIAALNGLADTVKVLLQANANGANESILNPQGYDALTLAVLHAGRKRLWEAHGLVWMDADIRHLIHAEQAAIELLRHAVNSRGYKIRCDSTKTELTLYHYAASRGLVNFIKVIFNETDADQLDVDCANADGITPLFLADLFKQKVYVQVGRDNPWEELIRFLEQHGGKTSDPTKDIEHSIIFNTVFGSFPNEFTLDLRPDVVHFVTSLLTSYEKSQNKSFRCSFVSDLVRPANMWEFFPVMRLYRKIDELLKRLSEDGLSKRFWRDFIRCSYYAGEFKRYILSFQLHTKAYFKHITKNKNLENLSKVQRKWFQKQLHILMKSRHTEVFRTFSCLKSLSSRLKSVFHFDARPVTSIVQEYEKCPPVNIYLNFICANLALIFKEYKYISSQLPVPDGEKELFSLGSTILELLLKRSLGFFRKYDYLKTLQVGIKPGTQVLHIPMFKYHLNNSDELGTVASLLIKFQFKGLLRLFRWLPEPI